MVSDINYWSIVAKRILGFTLTLAILFLAIKFSVFYMPFLVAFILALLIEPAIKALMKNFKWTRRVSSIFVMAIAIILILGVVLWGTTTLFNEANKLLQGSDEYFDKAKNLLDNFIGDDGIIEKLPEEIKNSIKSSEADLIHTLSDWITNTLKKIKDWVTTLPNLLMTVFFSLMALYFMCTDKIYMIDQMEHHLPDVWMKKIVSHLREITKSLGHYLKAEATLIVISFVISLIGLTIYKFVGLNVPFPLLSAIGIAFIDALPILGSSTIMIPWAIIEAINGDIILGVAIIILLSIMAVVRNIIEPKLVSKHIGIHPVFTLIAMYTGYKLMGVMGMIIGPILLIILKEIYSPLIEKGVFRSLFERGENV